MPVIKFVVCYVKNTTRVWAEPQGNKYQVHLS